PRLREGREDPADLVVRLDVGDRIRARCAPDRRLVDEHRLGKPFESAHVIDSADGLAQVALGGSLSSTEAPLDGPVEDVVDEGGLPGARHTGNHGESPLWDVHVDAPQVVLAGAADSDGRHPLYTSTLG